MRTLGQILAGFALAVGLCGCNLASVDSKNAASAGARNGEPIYRLRAVNSAGESSSSVEVLPLAPR